MRGFTTFQHYPIAAVVAQRARRLVASGDLGLVVAPALDAQFREDGLRADEGEHVLVRALATLPGVARETDVPVLVTRVRDDQLSAPIENAAADSIRCEQTDLGPRFRPSEFETLVYPFGDGLLQTTLVYWQRILEARVPEDALEPAEPTISLKG